MKKKNLLLLAAMAGICAIGLVSCRSRAEFSGGKSLSPAETKELLSEEPKEPVTSEQILPQEKAYYFVEGSGAVYHSDAACTYLKKSQDIKNGTLAQALAAGKERLCAACAKKQPSAPGEEQADSVCYYTAGGSVWHYDRSCGALARSADVLSGTVNAAMLDGKTRPCSRCGD